MANKSLFSSIHSMLPRATARNEAGGAAYALAPKMALAQLAATGCFSNVFYATAETQLDELCKLIDQVQKAGATIHLLTPAPFDPRPLQATGKLTRRRRRRSWPRPTPVCVPGDHG